MEDKYRLVVKLVNGEEQRMGGDDCHTLKSTAGRLFHSVTVMSVLVADMSGKVALYLHKERPQSFVNVPSSQM